MADITKMAQTAGTLSGKGFFPGTNRHLADGSLQHQYFQSETAAYTQMMGSFASNVFSADMQGLNPDDFFEWRKVKLRSIRAAQAQTGETMPSDWQRIYLIDPANYTYIPQGAMVKYADNTWLIYKDKNIAANLGSAVVRRCNAVINLLDWYGNIVTVPISYAKMGTLGNAPHTTENTITSKNYIACICQLNEYSEQFAENTRLILGKTAYAMRGLDNFTREFTDDPDSVHLLAFTIERVETQPFDNLEYGVANYYGFSWNIDIGWHNSMMVGTTQTLSVESRRNGERVESTEEHLISYEFTSSDESVATVDENGVVTAVSEGTVQISVALSQNISKMAVVTIEVPAAENQYVAFTTTIPPVLHEYTSIPVSAAFFDGRTATADTVEISFTGPEDGAFTVTPADEDNTYTLTAYRASPVPLVITATSGEYTATAELRLVT